MEKQCLRRPEETPQETLLRTTFQQHAPSTIDLEQGWEKIVPALRAPRKQISFLQASPLLLANAFRQQDEKRFLRHPRILVAAIAVLLVLIGIAAFPIANPQHGNQTAYAYAQVNQTQQDQGVKVTLIEAYASNGGIKLVAKMQLVDTGRGMPAPDFDGTTLRYQQETLTNLSGGTVVANMKANYSCQFYLASAVHPPVDAQMITLIWHVDKLLIATPNGHLPSHEQIIYGNWTFQFTIPFHHDNSKPSIPTISLTLC
jgi:hypothetical protein